jgi:hypothetical protein
MGARVARVLAGLAALALLAGSNFLRDPSFEEARLGNWQWQRWWYEVIVLRDGTKEPDLDKSFFVPDIAASEPAWDQESGGTAGAAGEAANQQWTKFRGGFYQTVDVTPGTCVRFSVWADEFCMTGDNQSCPVLLRAGIDPLGGTNWQSQNIQWTETTVSDSIYVSLTVPLTVVGPQGKATVFTWGEPLYPARNSAAFFDEASLVVWDICEQVFLPVIVQSNP